MCCNNGCGGGGNCCWIIILLIIIWCCCGSGGWGGCNNGCGCNSGCGCLVLCPVPLRARGFFYIGLDFAADFSKIEDSLSSAFRPFAASHVYCGQVLWRSHLQTHS